MAGSVAEKESAMRAMESFMDQDLVVVCSLWFSLACRPASALGGVPTNAS